MADASNKDLYAELGVARDASRDEIRKAYRKLARQNHPALNPGDDAAEERFKRISRAWDVLQDDDRRKAYDEFGEVSLQSGFDADEARKAREAFGSRFGHPGGQAGGFEGGGQEFHFGDLDDLLGGLFGGAAGGARTRGGAGGFAFPGRDLETTLELDFEEAVRGGEKRLTLSRPTPEGVAKPETLTVRIPPGVDTNGQLRLAGKGGPGAGGGPPGDLLVNLRVRPHRVFEREGKHLTLDLPVSVREATLGAAIEVPTLDGRVTLTIPPGTDSGKRLRLRGKGVPDRRGGKPGDLLVRIQIRVPKGVDDEAREAIEKATAFDDPTLRKELFE